MGEEIRLGPQEASFKVLGNLEDMVDFVRQEKIDMVYLALPFRAEKRLCEITDSLQYTTASVYLAPDIFIVSLLQAGFTDLKGIPLISLCETPFVGINGWLKRAEDLVLSTLIILFCAPVLLLIALGIKLTRKQPPICLQGTRGQTIFVDPELKLVMVQKAVWRSLLDAESERERDALWRGIVATYGGR